MKILETSNIISKYETAISYGILAMQYLVIAFYPSSQSSAAEKSYVWLWFFDIMLAIPVIIFIYLPDAIRRWIMFSILAVGFVFFFFKFGLNSVYLNTFIAIFLSHRFLLSDLDEEQKNRLARARGGRLILVFAVSFVVTVTESLLGKIGLITHQKVGDGVMMSVGGKIFLFVGYYSLLSYLEYKKAKSL